MRRLLLMKQHVPAGIRLCLRIGLTLDKILYVLSDVLSLILATGIALCLRILCGDYVYYSDTLEQPLLVILVSPFIAMAMGLYSSIMRKPPHKHLSRLISFVSITFSLIFIIFFISKSGHYYSRFVFLMSWFLSCFTVPLGRAFVTKHFCRSPWWGLPLICLDRSQTGKRLWHYLRSHPEQGLRPVAVMDVSEGLSRECHARMQDLARQYPGAVALLTGKDEQLSGELLAAVNRHFSRILVMPVHDDSSMGMNSFLTSPCVIDATTGIYLQQNLHDRRRIAIKRMLDLTLCCLGAVVLIPLWLIIALCIKLDSKGPVIYSQRRIGMGGNPIRVHKFRTMVENADAILNKYLEENPEMRAEWERDHKLKNDPRITSVGHFLRRTSLDELPQLWNVVTGTMSLVGPRPIVEEERAKYGSVFNEYIRVLPGITGLWQISGRNDTSYSQRVGYDFFYVSNWSVWLDIWIIIRTIPVVILRRGAY